LAARARLWQVNFGYPAWVKNRGQINQLHKINCDDRDTNRAGDTESNEWD
jgi:hypothetical protein